MRGIVAFGRWDGCEVHGGEFLGERLTGGGGGGRGGCQVEEVGDKEIPRARGERTLGVRGGTECRVDGVDCV